MGFLPLGDAGDVEDRVLVRQRVEAGVVAEGPLGAQFAQVDVALEHDLGVGRHFQVRPFRSAPSPPACRAGSRRSSSRPRPAAAGGWRQYMVAGSDADGHGHSMRRGRPPSAAAGSARRPACGVCQCMPVVRRRRPACGTCRSCACRCRGFLVKTRGRVMKGPPSSGQHCRTGKVGQREAVAPDDFLARTARDRLEKSDLIVVVLRTHRSAWL